MQVKQFLNRKRVPFARYSHAKAGSHQMAKVIPLPFLEMTKTVVCCVDSAPILCVLPSKRNIDFRLLKNFLRTDDVRYATKQEVALWFEDCASSSIPPFGSVYRIRTVMDASVTMFSDLIFAGETDSESFCMRFRDFIKIENPEIASFVSKS